MNASEVVPRVNADPAAFDFDAAFRAHYQRVARVIARLVRDRARSEELAVEVFLKFWHSPRAHGDKAEAWLYRAAVRKALDELRREHRRLRYERLAHATQPVSTPEDIRRSSEEQGRVRRVLASIDSRQASLLILRADGLTYDELASALDLNPASIGTFISRAQQAFRKEYTKRYGR